MLSSAGVFGESTQWTERARLLDPLSPYAAALSAFTFLLEFRDREALDCAEAALALAPNYPVALYLAAGAYGRCDRADEAVRCMERAITVVGRLPFYLGWLGWALGADRRLDEARAIQSELRERQATEYVPFVVRGWLHAALGAIDEAVACFERGTAEREPLLGAIHIPPFDPVRDSARFAALLHRTGRSRGPR